MADMSMQHPLQHPVNQTTSYPVGESDGSHLSGLEREWLAAIPSGSWGLRSRARVDWMTDTRTDAEKAAEWTPARLNHASALIVYRGEFGLSMGAVRCRHPKGWGGRTEETFEVSPFPGGWDEVRISQILLVRHPQGI